MRTLDITTRAGIPFRVVHYAPGETGPFPSTVDPLRELVEFYDARHVAGFTEHGQHVSRYLAETLRADGTAPARGLNLHGDERDWSIDAETYGSVLGWLSEVVYPAPTYARVTRELPWSEVCMHMRIAGKVMEIEPLASGMAQLWQDGRKVSFPITWGEAGIRESDLTPADPLAQYDDDTDYFVQVVKSNYTGTMSGKTLKRMIRASTKPGKDLTIADFDIAEVDQ